MIQMVQKAETVRVLLVDDHSLIRAGIRLLLDSVEGVEVVGEAGDGREALEKIGSLDVDIALMDIGMPNMNGLEAAGRVAREYPATKVIILSVERGEEYVSRSLRAGAAGYLLKDAHPAELELALRAVARGETYLTPSVSKQVVADYIRRVAGETGPLELLTPRQREILQLIAEGKTTKKIAQLLSISAKTVETHRGLLMDRLDIHDVAGLVRYAVKSGLVDNY